MQEDEKKYNPKRSIASANKVEPAADLNMETAVNSEVELTDNPLPIPDSQFAQNDTAPMDPFSRKVYLYLTMGEATDEQFLDVLDLLSILGLTRAHFYDLHRKIEKLIDEAHHREVIFNELKTEKQFAQFESLPDVDFSEKEVENLEQEEELVKYRDSLRKTIMLLTSLETSRLIAAKEYDESIRNLKNELPQLKDGRLLPELHKILDEEEAICTRLENYSTSEGETLEHGDVKDDTLDDFVQALEELETLTNVKPDGDSLFHLE